MMADLQHMNTDAFGWRLVDLFDNQDTVFGPMLALIDGATVRPTLEEMLAVLGLTRDELVGMIAIMEAREAGPAVDFAALLGFEIDIAAAIHKRGDTGKWSWTFHSKPGRPGAMLG